MVYNTTKVKIGLRYVPPVFDEDIGRDMIRLQAALLNKPKTLWQRLTGWLDV